jgi:hypothetical protein
MVVYALAATLISATFAVTLWIQYRAKPRAYLLVWSIALAVYAIAALTEVLGAAGTWNAILYRTYYFTGAILVVGVLALGTIYLLVPRHARLALVILLVLGGLGLVGIVGAGLQSGLLQTREVPPVDTIRLERGVFNILALAMAATISIVGSVVLIGGAIWSAYGAWRRGGAQTRVVANVLIAAGALIVGGASTLTRLFHVYELFYVGQAVGVLVMFVGFLAASRAPARATKVGVPATS